MIRSSFKNIHCNASLANYSRCPSCLLVSCAAIIRDVAQPSTDATIKLLHGILVTYKELKRFGITDCDKCVAWQKWLNVHPLNVSHSWNYVASLFSGSIACRKLTSASPRYNTFSIYLHQPPICPINRQRIYITQDPPSIIALKIIVFK